jgi:signal peptidase I
MRWFWFATFTLICLLFSVFFRQPLILIGELVLVDIFITRKVRWFFWFPKTERRIPAWLNLAAWLVVTVWVIRVLAIDSITILNPACKPGILPGDNILISKIHFGPRLPSAPFGIQLPYIRLQGITGLATIQQGDLLAYHFPEGDSILPGMGSISYYSMKRKRESDHDTVSKGPVRFRKVECREPEISRCIGLPGDTVTISDGLSVSWSTGFKTSDRGRPVSIDHLLEERGDYNIFPHDAKYPWNRDNFGPVIVPAKGVSIRLTMLNLCIYQRIIEVYEKNRLEIVRDRIFINGSPADTYTFQQDCFFVLGDNRHHSRDSRHWGFLPEDHIIGKPVLIWLSANKSIGQPFRIHWNRIFKSPK